MNPSAGIIRRWGLATLAGLAILTTGEAATSQDQPAFSFGGYQSPVGSGVTSDLSRLPPIDDESIGPQLETLPPPLESTEVWQSCATPRGPFDYYYGGKARGYYINDQ